MQTVRGEESDKSRANDACAYSVDGLGGTHDVGKGLERKRVIIWKGKTFCQVVVCCTYISINEASLSLIQVGSVKVILYFLLDTKQKAQCIMSS